MKEFMVAAFPMIVAGLDLAVIAVMYAKARKQEKVIINCWLSENKNKLNRVKNWDL